MKRILLVAALCVGAASAATAQQGWYFGIGAGGTSGKSLGEFGGTSKDSYPIIGGVAGYRWEQPNVFFGGELDGELAIGSKYAFGGVPCTGGANGPYYCEHNGTLRLRGVIGGSLSGMYEGFATLGVAAMSGKGAISGAGNTDTGVNTGFTVGAGVQRSLNNGGKVRAEVIFDRLDNTTTKPDGIYNPDYEAVSVKVTYILP